MAARRLHLFDGMKPGPDIAPLVAGPIDERLIAAHWNDVIRLAVSIRTGVTSASTMLERLGSYPRANGLALALREIGRVERTLFTLDWIESPEERRRATRELNKGEAENALKRAIVALDLNLGLPQQVQFYWSYCARFWDRAGTSRA